MKKLLRFCGPCLILLAVSAHALPRDAEAVLNRCGRPLKGDVTVFDNSVAGGHRTLKYERGFLTFERVGNDGWSFVSGEHKKETNLDADAMSKYMPCLKDGLADSAANAPIKKLTSMARVGVSMKRAFKQVILYTFTFLVVLGLFFFWLSRRPRNDDDLVRP